MAVTAERHPTFVLVRERGPSKLDFGHWPGLDGWGKLVVSLAGGMTMPPLSSAMLQMLEPFMPLFSRRSWPHALVLVAGTLLAPGQRTVAAALRVMRLGQTRRFECYH